MIYERPVSINNGGRWLKESSAWWTHSRQQGWTTKKMQAYARFASNVFWCLEPWIASSWGYGVRIMVGFRNHGGRFNLCSSMPSSMLLPYCTVSMALYDELFPCCWIWGSSSLQFWGFARACGDNREYGSSRSLCLEYHGSLIVFWTRSRVLLSWFLGCNGLKLSPTIWFGIIPYLVVARRNNQFDVWYACGEYLFRLLCPKILSRVL